MGGAVARVDLGGQSVVEPDSAHKGGFLVCDVAGRGDFYHVGGACEKRENTIIHTSTLDALKLDFRATYRRYADRIAIHAGVLDTGGRSVRSRSILRCRSRRMQGGVGATTSSTSSLWTGRASTRI